MWKWLMPIAVAASVSSGSAVDLLLPNTADSLKFAVIGDYGTGERPSYEIAARMAALRARFPFELVIMTGDNILERQRAPSDFADKFERPFGPLLRAGVRFYASLGNHDQKADRRYEPWNMSGQRYYTFAKRNVRFFALDTNRPDQPQLDWIEAVVGPTSASPTILRTCGSAAFAEPAEWPRGPGTKAGRLDGVEADVIERRPDLVGNQQQIEILRVDRVRQRQVPQHRLQRTPVFSAEQHYGEIGDLPRLNEGQRLEQLVERAESTRKRDERV
jgi:hypothetical protein